MRPVHERLRLARLERGEDLPALARRIGVRESHLKAIEAGHFELLPHGIYGRAAIRGFAEGVGFDGQAIVELCKPFLAELEDPIAAMTRVRGIDEPSFSLERLIRLNPVAHIGKVRRPSWRFVLAAVIDSAIVFGLLVGLVVVTMTVFGRPVLNVGAGPAFGIVGVLLAGCYFAVFGGVGGKTIGASVAGVEPQTDASRCIDLAGIATRAFRSAARDAAAIEQLAAWLGALSAGYRSSANQHDTQQAEQPAGS
jgi:hypothetical protein